ncbi:MAG: hypothetical protein UDG94_03975 [Peptococcaceae bacterium]|nr:hypothetical protein [Peptococcaceae bacterium]
MSKNETLTAYKCSFKYLKRNNPCKEDLKEQIKSDAIPEYNFKDFIKDFSEFTSTPFLVNGNNSAKAIELPNEQIHLRSNEGDEYRWMIVPNVGKKGKPIKIIKTDSGKIYNFNSKSAALYAHNIFLYQKADMAIAIFHRQNGSGCKSVFLEVANQMLRKKGMKLEMELYLPLISRDDDAIIPTKIYLQYTSKEVSSDIADNRRKKKHEIIKELGFNLEAKENHKIKKIVDSLKNREIDSNTAFAKIKSEYPDLENYNNAEIYLRINKREHKVKWNDLDSILGKYDITDRLYRGYKISKDFIGELTKLSDEYYSKIISEEK